MRNIAPFFSNFFWPNPSSSSPRGGFSGAVSFVKLLGKQFWAATRPKKRNGAKVRPNRHSEMLCIALLSISSGSSFWSFSSCLPMACANIFMTYPTFLVTTMIGILALGAAKLLYKKFTPGTSQPRWLVEMHTRFDLSHVRTHGAHQPTNETQRRVSVASRNTLAVPWGVSLPQETPCMGRFFPSKNTLKRFSTPRNTLGVK